MKVGSDVNMKLIVTSEDEALIDFISEAIVGMAFVWFSTTALPSSKSTETLNLTVPKIIQRVVSTSTKTFFIEKSQQQISIPVNCLSITYHLVITANLFKRFIIHLANKYF